MKADVDRLIEHHGPEIVIEAVRPMLTDERMQRIETVLDARLDSLVAVVENLHDPHNGAAAIRSLEAVGASTLHVVETVEHFHASPAVTIGAEKWIDVVRHKRFADAADALSSAGFTLYAACPGADHDIETLDVNRPAAIVFGNEHAGVTDETIARCDHRVSIPMHGFTQSFNLSVSVALTMYRLAQRRRQAIGRAGDLTDWKRAFLRARWYSLGIRGLDAIVARYVSDTTR